MNSSRAGTKRFARRYIPRTIRISSALNLAPTITISVEWKIKSHSAVSLNTSSARHNNLWSRINPLWAFNLWPLFTRSSCLSAINNIWGTTYKLLARSTSSRIRLSQQQWMGEERWHFHIRRKLMYKIWGFIGSHTPSVLLLSFDFNCLFVDIDSGQSQSFIQTDFSTRFVSIELIVSIRAQSHPLHCLLNQERKDGPSSV